MKKTILGVILAGTILLSNTLTFAQVPAPVNAPTNVQFTDITKHWSNGAVQNLLKKSAIPFGQGKFIPGKAIKKSEFAVMLHKALDIQIAYFKAPNIKDYFNDVKQEATYTSTVIDLVTANIIEGKGSFKPEGTITREEMAHYIMNAYRYKLGETYAMIKIAAPSFKDANKIKPEYSGDVALAVYYKLMSGVGKKLFNPKGIATRAEAAAVISNLMNLTDKQNSSVVIKPSVNVKDESIEMKLSIVNNSKGPITLTHSSGQKFDFVLLDAEKKELYRWSEGKAFTMMLTSSTIEAGESLDYSVILEGNQYKAIKDKAVYLKAYLLGSSNNFSINTEGYELKLK